MKVISVDDAKHRLPAIFEEALSGETIRFRSASGGELELTPVQHLPERVEVSPRNWRNPTTIQTGLNSRTTAPKLASSNRHMPSLNDEWYWLSLLPTDSKEFMHRLAIFIVFGLSIASNGQGTIDFMNRNIPGRMPGDPSYNVPIIFFDTNEGGGLVPGGLTVGLFEENATLPLVTTQLRTDTPANAAFFATATQTATTSYPAGSKPTLYVRAWQTSFGTGLAGYNAARFGGGVWGGPWDFITQPLGGTPAAGLPVPTPGMTGWGPTDGSGVIVITFVPEPSTIALGALGVGALLMCRRKIGSNGCAAAKTVWLGLIFNL
jgi:hypothetical protein